MTKKKIRIIVLAVVAVVLLTLIIWTAWGNTALELNTYTISSDRLPEAFDGYRIAHVSDLHNTEMGKGNEKLLNMLREAKPDMIAITGDLIDSRNTDIEIALNFMKSAMEIAPCYYVPGNHEARLSKSNYEKLENGLLDTGVIVLHDSEMILEKNGESISVIGIDDPNCYSASISITDIEDEPDTKVGSTMDPDRIAALSTIDSFTVLLSHRPEYFEKYVQADVDLVLSGHAHGGQFRLPFVGGLVAPNQGLFPKYDAGLYTEENTNMIVSRGIGNSIIPFRFNNRPEVILIELECA